MLIVISNSAGAGWPTFYPTQKNLGCPILRVLFAKGGNTECKIHLELVGARRIWTSDPLVPNQVLYQAEPRPDKVDWSGTTPADRARSLAFDSVKKYSTRRSWLRA